MSTDKQKSDYHARHERLRKVAENIERGVDSRFFGADFQLGYNFIYGEIVELQKEFNARFSVDMPSDPRFSEFYDRIIQILESSETVLRDSISPAKNKKTIAEHEKQLKLAETKPAAPKAPNAKNGRKPSNKPNDSDTKK